MIQAHLSGDKITSNQASAFSLYDKSRFGEKKPGKIEYSPIEALFLVKEGKMQITQNKKELSESQIMKKLKSKDKRIDLKLPVFSDFRRKGYVAKTALKFGTDFRIYKKGISPGQDHALWLVQCMRESSSFTWQDFAAKNRVAHSAKKSLIIAIVDDEDSVTHYKVDWLKP
ncbi:tRNA-intron lyase [Candidatus Pacearchaeota archaeon CG_4_9_14_0_2_um_filter_39_13]|nr:tRNA-intron lyase [Candidatus Pacearchaeota archaeon]OIO43928.1 MAG: tRNA-intron lyase [Candidatus Pacearchaeota archaeon CG1_02_39_14]PJC44779.1 MAG: tRNA-intron lyase [Candidatus Pacearchaeota archaeon CG_4_9_14_0_2_um_filter_39_13]